MLANIGRLHIPLFDDELAHRLGKQRVIIRVALIVDAVVAVFEHGPGAMAVVMTVSMVVTVFVRMRMGVIVVRAHVCSPAGRSQCSKTSISRMSCCGPL